MLGKAFFVEKVADCGASEQFLWRGLAVQSPARGFVGGLTPPSPCGGFRKALTPRYARCWAILAAWPVKLANQPKRPQSGPAQPLECVSMTGEGGPTPVLLTRS